MNKVQAIHNFWSSFGIPAYDESTVPNKIWDASQQKMVPLEMPYITYNVSVDKFENTIGLHASVWDHSTSWEWITEKVDEIARKLSDKGSYLVKIDDGYVWFKSGTPFAQRMQDDDTTRRVYINIEVEFLTRN